MLDAESGYILRKKGNEGFGKKVTKGLRPFENRWELPGMAEQEDGGLCGVKPRDVELQLECVVGESIARIIGQNHWIQWLREEASGVLGGVTG